MDDVGLVWMDIEGAEPEALKSMAELVRLRVPILMEYGPWRYGPQKTGEMAEYLSNHYGRSIVFSGKSEKEIDIRDVLDRRDILLLP